MSLGALCADAAGAFEVCGCQATTNATAKETRCFIYCEAALKQGFPEPDPDDSLHKRSYSLHKITVTHNNLVLGAVFPFLLSR